MMNDWMIKRGDCIEVMRSIRSNAIDSIVTDPPYELGFMNKKWDASGIAYSIPMWTEALRVLKPGGHLLAFGGTRTYHRMACAIEDAGFEIRDSIDWIHGNGFPKSRDVSKAIDKMKGAEREPTGETKTRHGGGAHSDKIQQLNPDAKETPITTPATDDAKRFAGYGTALKPAHEVVVIARKPLVGTVAANVIAYGTGGINVDGCRVGRARGIGRWPANIVLDEEAAAELDAQSGWLKSGSVAPGGFIGEVSASVAMGAKRSQIREEVIYADQGGASRFFYCAKASKRERGEMNDHTTVKPIALMRWLVRLVTPPGGIVLDPFLGSGTTAIAALREGFRVIGIEREEAYALIAEERIRSDLDESDQKG